MRPSVKPMVNEFRQRLWRWHFFVGLLVCPFLILISVTGSIYLFKPELEGWEEREINARSLGSVESSVKSSVPGHASSQTKETPLGEAVLLEHVLANYPGATFVRLTLARRDDRTVEFDILPKEPSRHAENDAEQQHHKPASTQKLTVWVDRYSGDLLDVKVADDRFLNIVKKLHSELLLGKYASYIVELVACWAIVLLISGAILWFHQRHSSDEKMQIKPSKQIFLPRIKTNQRVNLRTAHGVVGLYIAIPLLLMLLTGLPWTQLWGSGFDEVKKMAGWDGPGQEWFVTLTSGDRNAKKIVPETALWEISDDNERSNEGHDNDQGDNKAMPQGSLYTLTDLVNRSELKPLSHPIYISPPKTDDGVWTVRSMPQDRSKRVTLHFDQFSAEQLMRIDFKDHHVVQRVVSHGISLHEGALFGTLNKILVLMTALLTTTLSVLGLMAWWKRRLPNSLGVPRKTEQSLPMMWLVIIVVLGLFFPAVGISIVIVMSLEFLWRAIEKRVGRTSWRSSNK